MDQSWVHYTAGADHPRSPEVPNQIFQSFLAKSSFSFQSTQRDTLFAPIV